MVLKRKLPIDILVLAVVTLLVWAITIAWQIFDLNHRLSLPLRSESDAWLMTLTGLIFAFLFFAVILSAWSFILSVPTVLLAAHLVLHRHGVVNRWLVACATTAGLVGVLTHFEVLRYGLPKADTVASQSARAPTPKPQTLRDIDPALPPIPLNTMTQDEARAALEKSAEARARAKCAAPKDAFMTEICATAREAEKGWQAETDRAR